MIDPAQRWCISPGPALAWRHWDGQSVVYHEPSGDTHALNPLGAAVLRELETAPGTTAELGARAAASLGLAADELPLEEIAGLLARLSASGLIEPHDDPRRPGD